MKHKSHSRAFTPFCHAGLVSASSRYNNKTLGPRTKTLRGGTNGIVPVQGFITLVHQPQI